MKQFVSVILALCIVLSAALCVDAAEIGPGSITVTVQYEATGVTGGDLTAVRVGYVDSLAKVFRKFVTHDEITNVGSADTVAQMQNFYSAYKNTFDFDTYTTLVSNGSAVFSEIPMGLYLVYQENPAPGFEKLPSCLVTVPYNGEMNVSAVSKMGLKLQAEPVPPPIVTPDTPASNTGKLPQTGQLTWPIPWLAVTGIALFVLGCWLCFGRKEGDL